MADGWISTHRISRLFPNRPMLHRTVAELSFESGGDDCGSIFPGGK